MGWSSTLFHLSIVSPGDSICFWLLEEKELVEERVVEGLNRCCLLPSRITNTSLGGGGLLYFLVWKTGFFLSLPTDSCPSHCLIVLCLLLSHPDCSVRCGFSPVGPHLSRMVVASKIWSPPRWLLWEEQKPPGSGAYREAGCPEGRGMGGVCLNNESYFFCASHTKRFLEPFSCSGRPSDHPGLRP